MQYSDSDHTSLPVHSFYKSIMFTKAKNAGDYDLHDDPSRGMEDTFMASTFDNEATLLHKQIEAELGAPLTDPYVDPYESVDEEENQDEALWEKWMDFFKALDENEQVWNYIVNGENPQILDSVSQMDLIGFTKTHKLSIYSDFAETVEIYDNLYQNINRVFSDFIFEYYEMSETPDMITYINGVDSTGRDTVLRALDVLRNLAGSVLLDCALYESMIEEKIMNHDKFNERYDKINYDGWHSLKGLLNDSFSMLSKPEGNVLMRMYNVMNLDREVMLENFGTFDENRSQAVLFMLFALDQDQKKSTKDELTQKMIKFVSDNWLKDFIKIIKEDTELQTNNLNMIQDYINGANIDESLIVELLNKNLSTYSRRRGGSQQNIRF